MKKIIQLTCLVLILGLAIPISAKNIKFTDSTTFKPKKKQGTIDFIAYNSTSSTGFVYLTNTATSETSYFLIPANTPSSGTVVGQIPANDDIYEGSVTLFENTPRTMQLYFTYDTNVTYIHGTDMALGCGACAFVRID